jgi:hypothetical protein
LKCKCSAVSRQNRVIIGRDQPGRPVLQYSRNRSHSVAHPTRSSHDQQGQLEAAVQQSLSPLPGSAAWSTPIHKKDLSGDFRVAERWPGLFLPFPGHRSFVRLIGTYIPE